MDALSSGSRLPWLTAREATETTGSGGSASRIGFGGRRIDVVGIKSQLIVDLALLGIAENVVGFRDRLELFFGRLISRIYIRVIFAGQLAKALRISSADALFLIPSVS